MCLCTVYAVGILFIFFVFGMLLHCERRDVSLFMDIIGPFINYICIIFVFSTIGSTAIVSQETWQ